MFVNKLHEKAHETLKAGNINEAIDLYTKVLKEHPNHVDVLSDRGVAHLHNNDKVNCFADLDKAVELQPDYAYRYACRAFAKNHFKDIDGAVFDYEKAIELDPSDSVAHNNLGLLLEQKGYQDQAQQRFDRADKLSKMEEGLLDVIDELDQKDQEKEAKQEPTEVREEIDSDKSAKEEFKKVFTSKKQFREFVDFIKNGFKIK